MFLRSLEYHAERFHDAQENAWLAYMGGLDLVLDWSRRSGKSELIAQVMVEDVETYGRDCMYLALSQVQAREIMWQKFVKIIGGNRGWRSNETRLEWRHKYSNSLISLKGTDLGKDKLRGGGKRLIALDEWAFARDPSIYKEVLVPQLADYNGQTIFASTPKGKNHFWKIKQRALKSPSKYFTSHFTVFDNPYISDEGRAKLISEYAGTDDPLYRQEILAQYIDFEGLVFALPADSYTERRWDNADLMHSFHWRGMDHGYNPDPTAILCVAYNPRKGYFQVYNEYREKQLLIHTHTQAVNSLENFTYRETYSDIDPQLIAEYEAAGLRGITPAMKHDKESKLLMLVNWLKTGKVKIASDCTMLLDEMQTYEWWQDGNDHLIDAFRYVMTNITIPKENVQRSTQDYDDVRHTNDQLDGYGQDFDS